MQHQNTYNLSLRASKGHNLSLRASKGHNLSLRASKGHNLSLRASKGHEHGQLRLALSRMGTAHPWPHHDTGRFLSNLVCGNRELHLQRRQHCVQNDLRSEVKKSVLAWDV
jgi:hypothetical protein